MNLGVVRRDVRSGDRRNKAISYQITASAPLPKSTSLTIENASARNIRRRHRRRVIGREESLARLTALLRLSLRLRLRVEWLIGIERRRLRRRRVGRLDDFAFLGRLLAGLLLRVGAG